MRAVGFSRFGGPEVLGVVDLPIPRPSAEQAVIRVVAATVNPTDTLFRAGAQADRMVGLPPPFVPGMEFSGVVYAVGESAADEPALRPGDRVMGIVNPRRPGGGAQAEYVAVPVASLAPIPPALAAAPAATLPMNGLTARMAVEALDLGPGATVLVTGGAGAVGGYAIQLARRGGLMVYADAKDEDRELLRSLGASGIVARGAGMVRELRAALPRGVDGVVDAARLGVEVRPAVRDGGTIVSLRNTDVFAGDRTVRHRYVSVTEQIEHTAALAELAGLAAAGELTPRVAACLRPEEAGAAHALVERGGLRGRVVLCFGPDGAGR
ncbi:alcohol dehydrogenase catalytic domain-containing protein [Dactylosporangium salmoneum]